MQAEVAARSWFALKVEEAEVQKPTSECVCIYDYLCKKSLDHANSPHWAKVVGQD